MSSQIAHNRTSCRPKFVMCDVRARSVRLSCKESFADAEVLRFAGRLTRLMRLESDETDVCCTSKRLRVKGFELIGFVFGMAAFELLNLAAKVDSKL